ncbi:homeobox-leucine zipper protein HDG2 isoform X2 [Daucus carota subsp. sativus]|uniref:homeobox-leucine zipper protein HDG2 isoform X2 n=1 Tax=Daucus carota subsp. sativus TaxID=79200 RepID=UPI0007EF0A3A|nr:PREDICTED: homeobox-leucine zipper protein HDG2 [Daucus carota subsp. sativus]
MLFPGPDILMMEGTEVLMPLEAEMAQSNSSEEGDDMHGTMRTRGETDQVENQEYDGEEDQDGSGSQAGKGKRKRYHRHTQEQIQLMEAFFKECPHPGDKQRKELCKRLGLVPLQVKFWFQNKRTQMKAQNERHENTNLRAENESLQAENVRFREALGSTSCPNCGGAAAIGEISYDEHHVRLENAHLREEIDRLSSIAAKYLDHVAPPPRQLGFGNNSSYGQGSAEMYNVAGEILRSISGPPTEEIKPMMIELAVTAMEEFMRMAQLGEPLWVPGINGATSATLCEEEYMRAFPQGVGPRIAGFRNEASRETAVVIMNHISLVQILMDVNQWSTMFSGIVSRAMTLEVLSTGVAGNYNGALQVMTAEFQIPSPLVPSRESHFLRYCKQHSEGTWAVVDVSIDSLRPSPAMRCRRRPSGCLIHEMPNGYSQVTWIEHVEVDDSGVHNLYKPLLNSGLGFGAKRWVGALDRQCERLASAMATNVPTSIVNSVEGRKSMLKLAERMVISFSAGVSGSTAHKWTTLSGNMAENVRIMTRKSVDDPGRPPGIVLSAATSFWLPVPPKAVFDFLRDENSRNQWDILSSGGAIQEMAHFANGRETGNCVSLLRVHNANSSQSTMLILQESYSDPTASFIVYAPVDIMSMNVVINGGDPDYVALLPSGFAILPDGSPMQSHEPGSKPTSAGSLLTIAFQILVDSIPTAKISLGSISTVNNLINCTAERIKDVILRVSQPRDF